jgi:hypothetical protein
LTRFELRWARDAFEAIFPGPDGIRSLDVEGFLARMVRTAPLEPALGVRVAIWIVALAPLFVLRRVATIHDLSPEEREGLVVRLASNALYPVRQLVLLLKTVGALLYAGDATVRARLLAPQATVALRKKSPAHVASQRQERNHAVRIA